MKHAITTGADQNFGWIPSTRQPIALGALRADCTCGWVEKARTQADLDARIKRHLNGK